MKEIILISFSGREQGGVFAELTEVLAQYNADILDIAKTSVQGSLVAGLLVEVSEEPDREQLEIRAETSATGESHLSALKAALDALAQNHGLQLSFQPISKAEYLERTQAPADYRYILTLLSRRITAQQLASVTRVVEKHGLFIEHLSRLSGRVDLHKRTPLDKACVELSVSGKPVSESALKNDFMALSVDLDLDVAFQKDDLTRCNRRLVCFDMDSTLIEVEVIDELAKAAGVGEQVIAITESAMRGELDFNESFTARMALLKGLDESVLADIAARLPVTEGMAHLMSTLQKLGYKTAILSGGFNYFARYLQAKFGFDYVYANELDIVDGKVTGEVKGTIVNGERKAELLRELALKEGISLEQVIAVGDGANDLPMLGIAGLGVAFRAKPLVKASAQNSISILGLDAVLYLLGCRDEEV